MLIETTPLTVLPARFRPDWLSLLIAAIAMLGAALVLERVLIFGVALSADSSHYIHAARSLVAGEGLRGKHGLSLPFWPPLYPLLLAAASLGIFDPLAVAGPLNAILFGLTVFTVGRYLQHRLESRFLAAMGCLATALAVPLIEWSSWAHSEALFILLVTLALVRAESFLADGGARALVWAAAFSALAWQTRYIGGAVPAVVGLLLLFSGSATSMARRMARVTVYSLIVAAPMALWLLHKYLSVGVFTEHPSPSDYPVPMMLRDVVDILWSWPQTNAAAVLAPVICILVVAQWKRLTVADWRPFWLFGSFALAYLVLFIVAISLLVGIALGRGISERLLIPLYIPFLIAGAFVLDRVLAHEREDVAGSTGGLPVVANDDSGRKGSMLAVIVAVVLSLGVASQIVSYVFASASRSDQDLHFNQGRWTGSETLRYLRENLVAGRTHSNEPTAVSLHIGRKDRVVSHHPLARRLRYLEHEMDLMARGKEHTEHTNYLILFDNWKSGYYDYNKDDLQSLSGLELVAELDDGIIFKLVR